MNHIDKDRDGGLGFEEWRDFLLLLPHTSTLKNVIHFFNAITLVDFNSDAIALPDAISSSGFLMRLKYFWAGGIAGAISRTATAPLDRLKVLLQTQTYKTRIPTKDVYLKAIKKIYKDGGLLSFYKGNGLNVLKIFPESALKFFCFEYAKALIAKFKDQDTDSIGITGRFMAGGFAGLVSQFCIYPIETVKTRIMSQIGSSKMPTSLNPLQIPPSREHSILRTIRNLFAENGIKAFYRGWVPAMIGIIPYAGIDLAVFETLKTTYLDHYDKDRAPTHMILSFGIISGTSGAVLMYPISLIRTRFIL